MIGGVVGLRLCTPWVESHWYYISECTDEC